MDFIPALFYRFVCNCREKCVYQHCLLTQSSPAAPSVVIESIIHDLRLHLPLSLSFCLRQKVPETEKLSFCLSVKLSSVLLLSMPYHINRNVLSCHLPVFIGGCGGSDYGIRVDIQWYGFSICSSPFSNNVHTDVLLWVTYWGSSLELWVY